MQVPIVVDGFTISTQLDLPITVSGGLIANKQITEPTQIVTFDNLNAEVDGFYHLLYRIKNDSAPVFPDVTVYDIRPNGIIDNQHTTRWTTWSGTQVDQFNFWLVGGADANAVLAGEMWIYAASRVAGVSLQRYFTGHFTTLGDNLHLGCTTSGRWSDATTIIDRFDIRASLAGGIGVGSEFSLYKAGR